MMGWLRLRAEERERPQWFIDIAEVSVAYSPKTVATTCLERTVESPTGRDAGRAITLVAPAQFVDSEEVEEKLVAVETVWVPPKAPPRSVTLQPPVLGKLRRAREDRAAMGVKEKGTNAVRGWLSENETV